MGGDLVEVELDDEVPDAGPAAQARLRAAFARRARRVRFRLPTRWWVRLAAALSVVLAAGVGLDGAVAARLVAPPPGHLADLRAPRAELWRAPASAPLGLVGDTVVLESADAASVVARDLDDGHPVWSVPVNGCQLFGDATGTGEADAALVGVLAPDTARLLCFGGSSDGAVTAEILDAGTGAVLATVDGGPEAWAATVRDQVVVLPVPAPGPALDVAAYSLLTGERLWVAPGGEGWSGDFEVRAATVVVHDPAAAYDLRTGRPTSEPVEAADELTARTLPDGATVRTEWDGADVTTRVVERDGSVRWTASGYAELAPWPAGASVVPVQRAGGGVEVHDPQDGSVLWVPTRDVAVVGEVGGVLVALDFMAPGPDGGPADPAGGYGTALLGLDARTGDELWSFPSGIGSMWAGLVTDGTRLALATADGVEVRDARTGDVVARWRVPGAPADRTTAQDDSALPGVRGIDSGALVTLPRGRMLLVRPGQTVLLGW